MLSMTNTFSHFQFYWTPVPLHQTWMPFHVLYRLIHSGLKQIAS